MGAPPLAGAGRCACTWVGAPATWVAGCTAAGCTVAGCTVVGAGWLAPLRGTAPQAKPAIAADPGPAAGQGAPRNGATTALQAGTGQPATGQPAQQATQVAAAPTQAQRPAAAGNGGAAAPTQANGKQGANGKEDEEDWWTE